VELPAKPIAATHSKTKEPKRAPILAGLRDAVLIIRSPFATLAVELLFGACIANLQGLVAGADDA
jgi:hypothetical protein